MALSPNKETQNEWTNKAIRVPLVLTSETGQKYAIARWDIWPIEPGSIVKITADLVPHRPDVPTQT